MLETWHVKAALSAMPVKTDRKDARGIAQLLRMGWHRPVHAKSADARRCAHFWSDEGCCRPSCYGLKVGDVSRGRFEARIRDLIEGHDMVEICVGAMLQARAALWSEFVRLHRAMLKIVRADPVCQRLMSAPDVGALVALACRSAVDIPERLGKSRTVGAYFGLTPKNYNPARPTSTAA